MCILIVSGIEHLLIWVVFIAFKELSLCRKIIQVFSHVIVKVYCVSVTFKFDLIQCLHLLSRFLSLFFNICDIGYSFIIRSSLHLGPTAPVISHVIIVIYDLPSSDSLRLKHNQLVGCNVLGLLNKVFFLWKHDWLSRLSESVGLHSFYRFVEPFKVFECRCSVRISLGTCKCGLYNLYITRIDFSQDSAHLYVWLSVIWHRKKCKVKKLWIPIFIKPVVQISNSQQNSIIAFRKDVDLEGRTTIYLIRIQEWSWLWISSELKVYNWHCVLCIIADEGFVNFLLLRPLLAFGLVPPEYLQPVLCFHSNSSASIVNLIQRLTQPLGIINQQPPMLHHLNIITVPQASRSSLCAVVHDCDL